MANIFDLFRTIGSSQSTASPVSWLVVGLGNPGKEYESTRHNAGFMAIDAIAAKAGADVTRLKDKALVGEASLGETRVLLVKPQTYMNLSGEAVAAAASFYKIPPERVLVLCDDVSFDVGFLRFRKKGSAGGHNGLKSIIGCLGSDAKER